MTTPDYEKYTRRELAEAARSIDADRFPARAEKIRREIEKRDAETSAAAAAHPTHLESHPAPRPRRLAALLLDLVAFHAIWSLVEGAVTIPVPDLLLPLVRFALFCLLFSVRDGDRGVSFGKTVLSLEVRGREDSPLPRRKLLLRAAILGTPLYFPLQELAAAAAPGTPLLFVGVASGLLLGVLAYDALLVLTPSRRALRDRLLGTEVVHVEEVPDTEGEPAPPPQGASAPVLLERRVAGVVVVLAGGFLSLALLQGTHHGGSFADVLRGPVREANAPARLFEGILARDAHLRTSVSVQEVTQYRSDRPKRRLLVILVRVPYVGWTEQNRQAVLEGITRELRVEPGAYDELTVKLQSSVLFFHWGLEVPLTVNPA